MVDVSVILPTYNERENIVPLVEKIGEEFGEICHEIIVVDDNSSDGTQDAVSRAAKPGLYLLCRTALPSLASSIRDGLQRSKGQRIIIMDSDFNHKTEYLRFIYSSLEHFDCVSGSRHLPGGGMGSNLRERIHNFLSRIFGIFVRWTLGIHVSDPLYGYIGINRTLLIKCPWERIFWGYGDYAMRLFYFLEKNGARILEFPACNGKRLSGDGNNRFFYVFWLYFYETLMFRKRENKKKKEAICS
jgi:dolichol-phosphate mannosyltransferase